MKGLYTTSLVRLYDWLMKAELPGYAKERRVGYTIIESSMINQARDDLCDAALKADLSHILFIDDDMGFRPEALQYLISRKLPLVGCNYRMKLPPCPFTCRSLDASKWIETTEDSTGVEPVLFMGFGFCLMERRVMEAVEKPRFIGGYNKELGKYSTEDGPFMIKAAEKGFIPMVDNDASKYIYHIGRYCFSWDDKFDEEKRYPIAERF
jgi:hypothetical protein